MLHSRFRGELFDRCAKHPVEGWERMNDVGERFQRRRHLDRAHELDHDLAIDSVPRDHQRRRRATKNARAKRSRLSDFGIGFGSRAAVP